MMQSSNLKEAMKARDSYVDQFERDAFAAGYDHAHGIACHIQINLGEVYQTEALGKVEATDETAAEIHADLCHESESNARCYSPWEYTAKTINDLDAEHGEGATESAWAAYDDGVALAIEHDLAGVEYV